MIQSMESRILVLGPVSAGKTTLIRTISDIDVLDTDETPTDEVAESKSGTTVAMDLGVVKIDDDDRIVLYGAPGQARFRFMWEILLGQTEAILLLIDHSGADPVGDLRNHLHHLRDLWSKPLPVVIGITHVDANASVPLSIYTEALSGMDCTWVHAQSSPPIVELDARSRDDVRAGLLVLAALVDMNQRFGPASERL